MPDTLGVCCSKVVREHNNNYTRAASSHTKNMRLYDMNHLVYNV